MKRVERLRHFFHQNPELSEEEWFTQRYISRVLNKAKIQYDEIASGIIAQVGFGARAIAFRCDMDGLPIHEESEVSFTSKNQGMMHACGHDMHMAMALEALLRLKTLEKQLSGKVYFIFQPSEERRPGGARLLLPYLNDKIEAIFAQHIAPELTIGEAACCQDTFFASSDNVYLKIKGKGCHAATPELGANPILAVAQLICHWNTYIEQLCENGEKVLLSFTSVHGGEVFNIIPNDVIIKGTLRCHCPNLRATLLENLVKISNEFIDHLNVTVEDLNTLPGLPPVVNNNCLYRVFSSLTHELGLKLIDKNYLLGEDFSIYGTKYPSLFWTLGVAKIGEKLPPLHNPLLLPSDDALELGVSIFMNVALNYWENTDNMSPSEE